MPCDSKILQEVVLVNAEEDLVKKALFRMGLGILSEKTNSILGNWPGSSIYVTWTKGEGVKIEGSGNPRFTLNRLTNAYAQVVIEEAAKRTGWTVQWNSKESATVQRRIGATNDSMDIQLLDDGNIKVTTGKFAAANHMTAEAFMRSLARLGGGKQERKHKHGTHSHHHHDHLVAGH